MVIFEVFDEWWKYCNNYWGGVFTVTCAMADFDWFMNNSRARLFVTIFDRNGARVFYIILGVILLFFGFFYTK